MGIISALNPFTFATKYRAAWNALMAAYTFDQLSSELREEVIAKVEEIASDVRRHPVMFIEIVAKLNTAQLNHFFSLAMMNLNIRPALGNDFWFKVRNPHVDLINAKEILQSTKYKLEKKFRVQFPDIIEGKFNPESSGSIQSSFTPTLFPTLFPDIIVTPKPKRTEPVSSSTSLQGQIPKASINPHPLGKEEGTFLCPECGSRDQGSTSVQHIDFDWTEPPSKSPPNPWFGVKHVIYCNACGTAIPAHIAKLWGKSESEAIAEWHTKYRGHDPFQF